MPAKYSPYGEATHAGVPLDLNPYRWLGAAQLQNADGTDGAYKLGARYYETTGQFTQPDPLAGGMGDPRTLTRYSYAAGDPINQADPTGYAWWDDVGRYFGNFDLLEQGLRAAGAAASGDWNEAAHITYGLAGGATVTAGYGVLAARSGFAKAYPGPTVFGCYGVGSLAGQSLENYRRALF